MLLLKRMQFFGGLTIVLSVVNVLLLLTSAKRTVQEQGTKNKELYNGKDTTAPNIKQAKQSLMQALALTPQEVRDAHFIFSIYNIVPCTLQLVVNRNKLCSFTSFNCLVFGGTCFGISFVTFNYMILDGIVPTYLYACYWLLFIVNFCFLYQVGRVLKEAGRIEREQADNILLIRTNSLQTLDTDQVIMDTQV